MSIQEEEERLEQPAEPQTREFLAMLAALPWLLKQYFADSLNLLETEGRLAFRSLLMIVALTLILAAAFAGLWLLLAILAVYWAVDSGYPLWGIALAVVGLHLLLFIGLGLQMRSLARFVAFPNSRRAISHLVTRDLGQQPPGP